MNLKWIEKIGLATIDDGCLLVVRKRKSGVFILPGGKPERNERDLVALAREIDEELGCSVERPVLSGVFKDVAADNGNAAIVVRLYTGVLIGAPSPQSEIEEIAWLDLKRPDFLPLAPSIVNYIVPHLQKRARRFARSAKAQSENLGDQYVQGLLEL